jgi:hypothetical protein
MKGSMPNSDPTGRHDPRRLEQEQRNLEYFKGVAQAPLGWPAEPPTPHYIEPSDIERILRENPHDGRGHPWLNLAFVIILFAILFLAIVALL